MPKFKRCEFRGTNAATGDHTSLSVDVNINAEGRFYIRIPDEYSETACAVMSHEDHPRGAAFERGRRGSEILAADSFEDLKRAVETVLITSIATTKTEELVIIYGWKNHVAYWRTKNGEIVPNGYFDPEGRERNRSGWVDTGLDMHSGNGMYEVGIVAKVFLKVTFTRPNGTQKVKYKSPGFPNLSYETWGEKLNGFAHCWPDTGRAGGELGYRKDATSAFREIPYTEKAAEFFYNMMLGLCHLADRMKTFFEDDQRVQLAIASGAGPLLEYHKGEKA